MLKIFLFLVLVYAGFRFLKNIRQLKKTPQKKDRADYKKMDIQDADYNEIDNE